MGRVLVLFTILCSVLVAETALDFNKKKLLLKRFGMCKGTENYPLQYRNIRPKNTANGETFVDGMVKVVKNVDTSLTMKFNFWKCDASGNPDSCEYMLKDFEAKDICRVMTKSGELWSVFMNSFEKFPYCPIVPGIYKFHKLPISSEFMRYLPLHDGLWRIRLDGYDDVNGPVACVELDIQSVPFLRNRNG